MKNILLDHRDQQLADASQRPCSGILDVRNVVSHHADKGRESLLGKRCEDARLRTLKDGAKCHDGGFATVPVVGCDVSFDEGKYGWNDGVLDGTSEQT